MGSKNTQKKGSEHQNFGHILQLTGVKNQSRAGKEKQCSMDNEGGKQAGKKMIRTRGMGGKGEVTRRGGEGGGGGGGEGGEVGREARRILGGGGGGGCGVGRKGRVISRIRAKKEEVRVGRSQTGREKTGEGRWVGRR